MTNTSVIDHLLRHGIGFEPLQRFATTNQMTSNYPPYNIIQLNDDQYRLVIAVAGFTRDEINIQVERGVLCVKGEHREEADIKYLHRGLSSRSFERTWQLGEHIEVLTADIHDGLLEIDLERRIPEEKRPKTIVIGAPRE